MIGLMAWRNVWRNPGRSLVVIAAVMVGIWALIFSVGFMNGFYVTFINNAISSDYSHVQFHHDEFKKDYEIQYSIDNAQDIREDLLQRPEVGAVSVRVISNGMISSPKTASGIRVHGVDAEQEASVTGLDSAVVDGAYFEGIRRNPVMITTDIAEKLRVKVRSKIVLTFQDTDGDIVAGSFRVAGIIETLSPRINKGVVYVRSSDLQRILRIDDNYHEIAVLLRNLVMDEEVIDEIKGNYAGLTIESWRELAPELDLMQNQFAVVLTFVLSIIMLALGFGIINTMLMAVLERFREIGMLKAVGMKKGKVFKMVMVETIFLSVVGAPLGLLAGYLTIQRFLQTGIDLSRWAEGLKAYGYGTMLYPSVGSEVYMAAAFGVVVTAILSSIYPSIRAIKLKTVEALHKI